MICPDKGCFQGTVGEGKRAGNLARERAHGAGNDTWFLNPSLIEFRIDLLYLKIVP
jgi:hypothetical protein